MDAPRAAMTTGKFYVLGALTCAFLFVQLAISTPGWLSQQSVVGTHPNLDVAALSPDLKQELHHATGQLASLVQDELLRTRKGLASVAEALEALKSQQANAAFLQHETSREALGIADPKASPFEAFVGDSLSDMLPMTIAPLYSRSRPGSHIHSTYSVTTGLCGLSQEELMHSIASCERFDRGARWYAKGKWHTWNQLFEWVHPSPAGDIICIVAYFKLQLPCPKGECLEPIYLRPNTTDVLVLSHMYVGLELGFIADYSPRAILDGGGNIGLASQLLGTMFPHAIVVAVEASSSNYRSLCLNTAHLPNVIPLHAGLWSRTTTLEVANNHGEWGHVLTEIDNCEKSMECVNGISVDLIIDMFQIDHFDYMKLDIESSEKPVFTRTPTNRLDWLNGVELLSVEPHDQMVEGCQETVEKVLADEFDNTWIGPPVTGYILAKRRTHT